MGFLAGKDCSSRVSCQSVHCLASPTLSRRRGRLAFSFAGDRLNTSAIAAIGLRLALQCDVATTPRSTTCSQTCCRAWPRFDGFVHSIGYAQADALASDFCRRPEPESSASRARDERLRFCRHDQGRPARLNDRSAPADAELPGAEHSRPRCNAMGLAKASLEPWCVPGRVAGAACGQPHGAGPMPRPRPVASTRQDAVGGRCRLTFAATSPLKRSPRGRVPAIRSGLGRDRQDHLCRRRRRAASSRQRSVTDP